MTLVDHTLNRVLTNDRVQEASSNAGSHVPDGQLKPGWRTLQFRIRAEAAQNEDILFRVLIPNFHVSLDHLGARNVGIVSCSEKRGIVIDFKGTEQTLSRTAHKEMLYS